jgi:hypothetical protein
VAESVGAVIDAVGAPGGTLVKQPAAEPSLTAP